MTEHIIDLIQTHTAIIDGKPAGLTHRHLNKIYDSLISKKEYPNSVPKLGTLLAPLYDSGEIISGEIVSGDKKEFIVYHVDTYDRLEKALQKEVQNVQ